MVKNEISAIDIPLRRKGFAEPDTLGTTLYADVLAEFIANCATPLTVGVQGEWGSGKTSILNLVCEHLESKKMSSRQRGVSAIDGAEYFKTIWINTWEHSLLKTPEECLLSIISEIIDEIASVDGRYQTAQRAKDLLSAVAKGAVRVGASLTMGGTGAQVADELTSGGPSSGNTVKQLRATLRETVDMIVESDRQKVRKFVIIIDDLDRLDPPVAVSVLELLKNIFDIEHCVFVLAIDYQVVVKGLKKKFGEQTEANEWEFRAFFDKIIQLPFMMPIVDYDLDKYLMDLLDGRIFNPSEVRSFGGQNLLSRIVSSTVGMNPRALKRLVNSFSLVWKYYEASEGAYIKSGQFKLIVFSLICFQISMPKIYEIMLRKPLFYEWDNDFAQKLIPLPGAGDKEMHNALESALEKNEEDFDEDWEQSLFKIVWANKWQRDKLTAASRLLSILKDEILPMVAQANHEPMLIAAMRLTSVTSISATDAGLQFGNDDANPDLEVLGRNIGFWNEFAANMKGTGSVFDVPLRSTRSVVHLSRKPEHCYPEMLTFIASSKSNWILKIVSNNHSPKQEMELFLNLRKKIPELREIVGAEIRMKIGEDGKPHSLLFNVPSVEKRLDLASADREDDRNRSLAWLAKNTKLIEDFISAIDILDDDHKSESSTPIVSL